MRFDTVVVAPPFATGRDGDLFLAADHDRLDNRLGAGSAVTALARFAEECRDRGLRPMLDVVVDRIAAEHATNSLSSWYRVDSGDELPDPRQPPHQASVARLATDADLAGLVDWWAKRFIQWAHAGIDDFRCLRPHQAPSQFWHELIFAVRRRHPQAGFMASAFEAAEAGALTECGFDLFTSCSRNWDYRAEGFFDAVDQLARIASVIAMPEAPFDRRLSRTFRDTGRAQRAARRALAFTTAYGAGWLMPMGFEFGAARDMDPARDRPEDLERLVAEAAFDLSTEITEINSRFASSGKDGVASVRSLAPPEAPAAALLVTGRSNGAKDHETRLVLVNASLDDPVRVPLAPLLTASGIPGALTRDGPDAPAIGPEGTITIGPG